MHFLTPALHRLRPPMLALAIAGALALGAGPASASSLTAANGALTYTAAAGEANHVTFWFDLRYGTFVIQDTGVQAIGVPASAKGCHSLGAQTAYCEWGRVTSITAHLGDGGSFAQSKLVMTPVTFHAGAGDDVLIGGGGADTLIAAGGADNLTAGSGNTRLVGGSGSTTMTGGSGHNAYVGGPGADTIDARNGVAESVTCAGGDDRVTADSGDATATDCESVDRGDAVAGPEPEPGPGGTPDTPDIDPGLPVFAPPIPAISTAPVVLSASNEVPIVIGCPATLTAGCRGSVTLALAGSRTDRGKLVAARRGKRVIGRTKRYRIAAGDKAAVPVVLSRRGARYVRRRVRRGRKVGLAVTVRLRSEAGTQRTSRTVTVRAARRPRRP